MLFTGAKSLRNIALYQSVGYQPVSPPRPDGTVCLAK